MQSLRAILVVFASVSAVIGALATPAAAAERVLSVGGSITEIVYALGQGDRLVARDTTSSFPPEATALPDVGYMRRLSPEGVLSVGPDLILLDEGAGPPDALDVLRAARVPMVVVPDTPSREGILEKIHVIGEALGVDAKAKELSAGIESDFDMAAAVVAGIPAPERARVLFILSTQGGRILAAGRNTSAAAIIELAGGINAVDAFEGYKPVTDEAVAAAAPDWILMMDRGGSHSAATDELVAMPALASTEAARNRAVIRMNGLYLLGFGPRTAQAIVDLNSAIYGE
ncbi:MAG: ABC transporter substrate-binding protein [Pseudomonadota bacterium]